MKTILVIASVLLSTSTHIDLFRLGQCEKCAQPIIRCEKWPERVIHAERCWCTRGHVTYRVKDD